MSRRPIANVRQIAATDKQIDQLVSELSGLTKEEVRIVKERETIQTVVSELTIRPGERSDEQE